MPPGGTWRLISSSRTNGSTSAAARGNEDARNHRIELAREMSTDQVAEAQRLAREWLQTH